MTESQPALLPCPCIGYDPADDDDYAECECGHSVEEHPNGPCEGEVDSDV